MVFYYLLWTGIAIAALSGLFICWAVMIRMPGKSYFGEPPILTHSEVELSERLKKDVEFISLKIGERNVIRRYSELISTANYIEKSLTSAGFEVIHEKFESDGKPVSNIYVEKMGAKKPDEIVIIGAHYDTVPFSPGANDNASAVAANLELARLFSKRSSDRTLRFVFFVNEEYPYFMTKRMGSLVHAMACARKEEDIKAMLCLECVGCYSRKPKSQKYPFILKPFYPIRGDFITFVGNVRSRALIHGVLSSFRKNTKFPSEGIAATELVRDICRSDHYPFWKQGWPALMVTDTANFRYKEYHTPDDLPHLIDFDCMSRVTMGLYRVIDEIQSGEMVCRK